MSALDTAKEIGRMAATATLSKDVVDLLKERVALLSEQVAALETENTNLKKKVSDLEQELGRIKPKGELADDTAKVLKLLFEHDGLTVSQLAHALGLSQGMADYHCGVLRKALMIQFSMFRSLSSEDLNYITQKGREYIVKHVHV